VVLREEIGLLSLVGLLLILSSIILPYWKKKTA